MNHRSRPPWYTWNPHELLLQHRAEMTSKYTPVHAQQTNPHTNTQRKRMSMTSRSSVVRSVLIDHQQQVLIAQAPLIFFLQRCSDRFQPGTPGTNYFRVILFQPAGSQHGGEQRGYLPLTASMLSLRGCVTVDQLTKNGPPVIC